MEEAQLFGLIGKNISYSFSKGYFAKKFKDLGLENCDYRNFDLLAIAEFPFLINANPHFKGLNVTIPYKEAILPFLDEIATKAKQIGAVNTIRFKKDGVLKGYNTDYYGFKKSLQPLLEDHHKSALILGTGGAAKAIAFALDELAISHVFVSREATLNSIDYKSLDRAAFEQFQIVVNCTPLGTTPNIEQFPDIPYEYFSPRHIAFDLIYNPAETLFLNKAKLHGAIVKNGYEMLCLQADKAWTIWHK